MSLVRWSVRPAADPLRAAEGLWREGAGEGIVLLRRGGHPALEFCAIIRPSTERNVQMLQLMAAFAAVEGIRKDTGIIAWTRWPSEAEVNGAVVARTSLAMRREGESNAALLGFSVNCSGAALEGSASLLGILGVEVDRPLLMERILSSFSWTYLDWNRGMHERVRGRIQPSISSLDSFVTLLSGGRVRYRVSGIGVDGSLLLRSGEKEVSISTEESSRVIFPRGHPYL